MGAGEIVHGLDDGLASSSIHFVQPVQQNDDDLVPRQQGTPQGVPVLGDSPLFQQVADVIGQQLGRALWHVVGQPAVEIAQDDPQGE